MNIIQGRLDCVKLEMINMILEDNSLISSSLISKAGYDSVVDFVFFESKKIFDRNLYRDNPFSIEELLKVGEHADDLALSSGLKPKKLNYQDLKESIKNKKIVKTLIKTL